MAEQGTLSLMQILKKLSQSSSRPAIYELDRPELVLILVVRLTLQADGRQAARTAEHSVRLPALTVLFYPAFVFVVQLRVIEVRLTVCWTCMLVRRN